MIVNSRLTNLFQRSSKQYESTVCRLNNRTYWALNLLGLHTSTRLLQLC
jgi:hypothetical protein